MRPAWAKCGSIVLIEKKRNRAQAVRTLSRVNSTWARWRKSATGIVRSSVMTSSGYANTDNYTTIQVYYRSLKYTWIGEQAKMNIFDIISNIGGTLGLFVGLSFVSLFEITEILLEALFIVGKIKWKKLNHKQDKNLANSTLNDNLVDEKLVYLNQQGTENRSRTRQHKKELK